MVMFVSIGLESGCLSAEVSTFVSSEFLTVLFPSTDRTILNSIVICIDGWLEIAVIHNPCHSLFFFLFFSIVFDLYSNQLAARIRNSSSFSSSWDFSNNLQFGVRRAFVCYLLNHAHNKPKISNACKIVYPKFQSANRQKSYPANFIH